MSIGVCVRCCDHVENVFERSGDLALMRCDASDISESVFDNARGELF